MLDQVFDFLWYLIPFGLLIVFLKSAFFKGIIGEAIVNFATKIFLDKKIYFLLKNITLPTENGTTQIDHIIVSKYGIFVVETKNMKGWIFGNSHQKTWTQKIYKHTNKFQNPLHQNFKHVKTIETTLGVEYEKIFSVIVFVGSSTFKTPMPENVTNTCGYIQYIKSKNQVVFSDYEVSDIVKKIESGRLKPSIKTHFAHVKHVKSIIEKKQNTKK